MADREKLIELIQNAVNGCARHWAEIIADYLLANGVTVPKPKTIRPPADLKGKCGSCIYAKPNYGCFGGSSCYVDCTNVEHIGTWCKRDISITRQRTHKACKLYQKRSDSNATQQPDTE